MSDLGRRIANLTPEQRALLEKRVAGESGAAASHAKSVARAATQHEPIAIVGAACRFPGGANDVNSFWQMLRDGVDGITEVPAERWDAASLFDADATAPGKISSRWGGFIRDVDQFDAAFFGISPREAQEMDPQQRVLLEVAFDALDHAGLSRDELIGSSMGVFVGVHGHASDYLQLQNENVEQLDGFSGTGSAHNLLAGRLSYLLDTHGPAVVIDTACSSSLVAVHYAVQSLRAGESSSAIVGGVNLILTPSFTIAASRMHMLAPDGRCKAFDQRANGFVRSEGCGVVVLKRLSDAIAHGDRVMAVIRGSAINQDGHTNGITAPNGLAQQNVIERALTNAGVAGQTIGFIEAHGTGTALGDPIEMDSLTATIGAQDAESVPCFVGSAKTNIGHLEGAAGIAGLIKAALTVERGEIAPNLHFTGLNPLIRVQNTRFAFPTRLEAWNSERHLRRAGVSSFGWSGTNAHVVIEQAPAAVYTATPETDDVYVLPMSARSPAALTAAAEQFKTLLDASASATDSSRLARDICYTAALRRTHANFRAAVTGRTVRDLAAQIESALENVAHANQNSRSHAQPPRVAFVFPGHGSQWLGMGVSLLQREPVFRDMIVRCDALIRENADWSLLEQVSASEQTSRLHEVEVAQPALFAFGVALAELWKSWGVVPDAVAGHSMGEVAAAYVAGALSLEQATRIICKRSQLLQQVASRGGMLVVELTADEAQREIAGLESQLNVAALNGPRSTVIAGDFDALDKVSAKLTAREVFCRIVKGSPAGHSHHVQPLGAMLREQIGAISTSASTTALYSTVTGNVLDGTQLDANYWVRNFCEPVRFLDTVRAMLRGGIDTVIEMSPHPILSSVVRDIAEDFSRNAPASGSELSTRISQASVVALPSLKRGEDEREVLMDSVARLYERGATLNWRRIAPMNGALVALPRYPWQRERYWLERTPRTASAQIRVAHQHPASTSDAAAENVARHDMSEWLYESTWVVAPHATSTHENRSWLLIANDDAPSASFAAQLDVTLRTLGSSAIIANAKSNVADQLARAAASPSSWRGIVHLAGLDATNTPHITTASLAESAVTGAQSLLDAVRSLDSDAWPNDTRLWVITRGAVATNKAARSTIAISQAPLRGMARVVEAENPGRFAASVDVDASSSLEQQAIQLVAELQLDSDETAIALRNGQRLVERLAPIAAPATFSPVVSRADSSYVVTGGLTGVGLVIARRLVEHGARRLIVFGRTPLPPRSQWRAIVTNTGANFNVQTQPVKGLPSVTTDAATRIRAVQELEALGATVHYHAVDIADESAVAAVFNTWRDDSHPPIRGVVHAAGVVDDRLLVNLDDKSIKEVFSAKAVGAWVLNKTLSDCDWMIFCSSLASIWPAAGQASYAAANAFLDALANYRSANGKHALSLSWGYWSDVGLATTSGGRDALRQLSDRGLQGFSAVDGIDALEAVVRFDVSHAAVFNANRSALGAATRGGNAMPLLRNFADAQSPAPAVSATSFVAQLKQTEPTKRVALLQERVSKHIGAVLKMRDTRVDAQKPLGEYGMNSIMGLELRHQLERDLDLRLSATLVFNYPSVSAITLHLVDRLFPVPVDSARTATNDRAVRNSGVESGSLAASTKTDALVQNVQELSDDAALAAMRGSSKERKR